jgi:beta-glucosidase
MNLPDGFAIGVSHRAPAIEGALFADGRGESIWDRFTSGDGAASAALAFGARGYENALADVAPLARLGFQRLGFSLAWPRVQPAGRGRPNRAALDHYARVVDALLAAGIEPVATLYGWDLPQALEEAGGWPARDTAGRFADFAEHAARALADRVAAWVAFDRPSAFLAAGYATGAHAPGRGDADACWRALHVVNLALGDAVRAIGAARADARIGTAVALRACVPRRDVAADADACVRWRAFEQASHLEPALTGAYPEALAETLSAERLAQVEGDAARLRAPLAFVALVAGPSLGVGAREPCPLGLHASAEPLPEPAEQLAGSLREEVARFAGAHPDVDLELTLDLASFGPASEAVQRERLETALGAALAAHAAGVRMRAFDAAPFLDGFDFDARALAATGLVAVDHPGGARTPREPARWLGRVASARTTEPG